MSPLLRLCLEPGCTATIPITRNRCAQHQREARRRDNPRRMAKPQRWVYTDKRWHGKGGTRERVLAGASYQCVVCGQPANTADHHPLTLAQLLERSLDPFDPAYCRALCPTCSGRHDGKRSTERTASTPTIFVA